MPPAYLQRSIPTLQSYRVSTRSSDGHSETRFISNGDLRKTASSAFVLADEIACGSVSEAKDVNWIDIHLGDVLEISIAITPGVSLTGRPQPPAFLAA